MAKIATHSGTCQGCGHHQKLPGGKLSLHGYTVQWGFFSGTCDGARELPYELSCDYCKKCIVRATASREALLESAKNYRRVITEPVADHVSINMGYDRRACKSIYKHLSNVRIEEVREILHADTPHAYENVKLNVTFEHEGETKVVDLRGNNQTFAHNYQIETALDAAKALNEQSAVGCDQRAAQMLSYIKWQQERVNNWKLKELTPVVDVAKTVGNGDKRLIKSMSECPEALKVTYYSGYNRWTRNGQYTQAIKLVSLGHAEIIERHDEGRPWIRVRLTDQGRAFFTQEMGGK